MHHGLAVGADLEVGLDTVAGSHRGGEGCGRVLDHAGRGIVQTAVSDRLRGKPIELPICTC